MLNTISVMAMAKTPSVNASTRFFVSPRSSSFSRLVSVGNALSRESARRSLIQFFAREIILRRHQQREHGQCEQMARSQVRRDSRPDLKQPRPEDVIFEF